ncbi:MAG: Gfo/Idh/MocA family oxidoreductase [Paenibacillus macerans]|uniref:Oxidoreductase, NAD-binding Rossmann fold family protein n=2 Tax=Paenibacillus macerans TaxID=44252 RepID=A0A090ZID1_PAEMA|nr:Gfo/Idh/MocA family oxidoreductase [Paenibacillus macerans]KFN10153.1 oxidoreductase, NAD-binding Rossmann fold family protein [Paenibacillus macerans]MCY7558649.1 Gfo/Idh/MocA family oxidoreductase [Paenibacillus macerans]MDU7477630.1 Gfo/Idh/MocA family oxidoreductase [Paenibacillus macerans]SUA82103.1 oxidoreductase domain-containing protein [Paenibacillus macerans]
MEKIKVGIIGCGKISGIYMENCRKFAELELAACADLDLSRAREQAERYGIPRVCTVEELLGDPDIAIVINLTIPAAHAEVCLKALEAGKHVYVEKPLAVTREDGLTILETARRRGLLVGSAPETFFGAGIQTALKLIRDGAIGRPVSATAFMMSRGHEHWHPDPEFYYAKGGGPMFDMGPYYLTALIQLLGPIRRIAGITGKALAERTITSEKKRGQRVPVEVPTHVAGTLEFAQSAIATLITSFDVFGGSTLPPLEIHGTEGTLLVPDPNTFGGPVKYRRLGATEWTEAPLLPGYAENSRGIGPADMAAALLRGRPHRASGELAYHVLEAMWGFHDSSDSGRYYEMQSTCTPPAPLPADQEPYHLD